jgi:hypothetical protein
MAFAGAGSPYDQNRRTLFQVPAGGQIVREGPIGGRNAIKIEQLEDFGAPEVGAADVPTCLRIFEEMGSDSA